MCGSPTFPLLCDYEEESHVRRRYESARRISCFARTANIDARPVTPCFCIDLLCRGADNISAELLTVTVHRAS